MSGLTNNLTCMSRDGNGQMKKGICDQDGGVFLFLIFIDVTHVRIEMRIAQSM